MDYEVVLLCYYLTDMIVADKQKAMTSQLSGHTNSAFSKDEIHPSHRTMNERTHIAQIHTLVPTSPTSINLTPQHKTARVYRTTDMNNNPSPCSLTAKASTHVSEAREVATPISTVNNIKRYMRNQLPQDILADYEEFSAENEDASYDLTELAELVRQDVVEHIRSRTNSTTSSTTSVPLAVSESQCSSISDLTFMNGERPLQLCIDRQLFLDRIISQRHTTDGKFIYRCGIKAAQLYYSKELSSRYELITPRLLYSTEQYMKDSVKSYISKVNAPTLANVSFLFAS